MATLRKFMSSITYLSSFFLMLCLIHPFFLHCTRVEIAEVYFRLFLQPQDARSIDICLFYTYPHLLLFLKFLPRTVRVRCLSIG
jgi:hypothetical protein